MDEEVSSMLLPYATRMHPLNCNDLKRVEVFFDALREAEHEGRNDAWEYAAAQKDTVPRCVCFQNEPPTPNLRASEAP